MVEEFKNSRSIVFSATSRLATRDIQDLRASLRAEGVAHKVVKLTLVKRALEGAGLDASKFDYNVPLSVSWSKDDEVAPAKILQTFAKTHENLKPLGGLINKSFVDAAGIKALAALPSKQELYAQLVYTINAPLLGLLRVINGSLQGLINVLSAKAKS